MFGNVNEIADDDDDFRARRCISTVRARDPRSTLN